ncbi:MAG: hypothetical protein JWR75_766 [Devosia sp.]|nr:hypothetical protein [Devosia sp.]
MPSYVALLYSIVLSPGKRLLMTDLKAVAADLGLEHPRTVLATGNLVFSSPRTGIAALEADLEAAFATRLGKHVDIIIRTAPAWLKLVAANPFPEQSAANGSLVAVRVQRQPVSAESFAKLETLKADGEALALVDGDLWFAARDQLSTSRLFNAMTVKRLGIGTWRNWNTTRKLGELLSPSPLRGEGRGEGPSKR